MDSFISADVFPQQGGLQEDECRDECNANDTCVGFHMNLQSGGVCHLRSSMTGCSASESTDDVTQWKIAPGQTIVEVANVSSDKRSATFQLEPMLPPSKPLVYFARSSAAVVSTFQLLQ